MILRFLLFCCLAATAAVAAPPVAKNYDLVVYGGTPAGLACSVRAAREGLTVLLVSPWPHLGGLFSNGISTMDALYAGSRSPLYDEYRQSIYDYYRKTYGLDSEQYQRTLPGNAKTKFEAGVAQRLVEQMLAAEKLITVVKPYRPLAVTEQNRLLTSATFQKMDGTETFTVAASAFADCSYEGDFFVVAKVPYRLGRESRSEFNEQHAGRIFMRRGSWPPKNIDPEVFKEYRGLNIGHYERWFDIIPEVSTGEGDKSVQAYNMRTVITRDPNNRVPVEKPAGYDPEELISRQKTDIFWSPGVPAVVMPNSKAYLNLPQIVGLQNAYPDGDWAARRRIIDEHSRITLSLIYFMQNDPSVPEKLREGWKQWGLAKDEFPDNRHLPYEIYVREGRRIKGRQTFTENDARLAPGLRRSPIFTDSISITDWFLDSHGCTPEKAGGGMKDGTIALNALTVPAQVPFGTILPENLDNLLVPLCVSATHVGWGALRLEPAWMSLGEAAAQAVVLARESKIAPANVDRDRLVRRLAESHMLITFFNDIDIRSREPWMPAVQYFGTQGFFGSFDSGALDGLREPVAAVWAEAAAEWLTGKPFKADERARRVLAAEKAGGEVLTVREFTKVLSEALTKAGLEPKLDAAMRQAELGRDMRMGRGAACRLIYALGNPTTATPSAEAPAPTE